MRKADMENFSYMRAVLRGYPSMQDLAEASKARAENLALLSYKKYDTLPIMYEVIGEIAFSETVMGVKEALDEILSTLKREERLLLELRYFHRKSVILALGEGTFRCSRRQFFRKLSALNRKIGLALARHGFPKERIERDMKELFRLYPQNSSSGGGDFFPLKRKTAMTTAAAQARTMTTIPATGKPSF